MVKIRTAPKGASKISKWIARAPDRCASRARRTGSDCCGCGAERPAIPFVHHPRFFGPQALRPVPAVCSRRCYFEATVRLQGRSYAFRELALTLLPDGRMFGEPTDEERVIIDDGRKWHEADFAGERGGTEFDWIYSEEGDDEIHRIARHRWPFVRTVYVGKGWAGIPRVTWIPVGAEHGIRGIDFD